MSSAVASGVFGLAGVALGFGLNAVAAARTRKQVSAEDRERERRQRELLVAERLDEALVLASAALDRGSSPLDERYHNSRQHWEEAWVAYSSRLRHRQLLRRYRTVGSLLLEVVSGDRTAKEIPRFMVARAIANARAALAYFMRGEDELPVNAFPEPDELRHLLGQGDNQPDRSRPLKSWLGEHPMPEFHPSGD